MNDSAASCRGQLPLVGASVAAVEDAAMLASIALATALFTLQSQTFTDGSYLAAREVYNAAGCHGGNVSPELHWSNAPAATRSFALIVHDPDAPVPGGWYHWVVYNLGPRAHEIRAGEALPGRVLGTTSFRGTGYGGPCPPPGKAHHYIFTLYALDVTTIPGEHLTGPQLETAMRGHVLASTRLVGLYAYKR